MNQQAAAPSTHRKGMTLIEISLVIFLLVALMGTGLHFSSAIQDWKLGSNASEELRSVYTAQRTYLADHPTTSVSSLTKSKLKQYLPNNANYIPWVEGLDGKNRDIKVNVSPPVIINYDGSTYDPSGDPKDSLWDVGE